MCCAVLCSALFRLTRINEIVEMNGFGIIKCMEVEAFDGSVSSFMCACVSVCVSSSHLGTVNRQHCQYVIEKCLFR